MPLYEGTKVIDVFFKFIIIFIILTLAARTAELAENFGLFDENYTQFYQINITPLSFFFQMVHMIFLTLATSLSETQSIDPFIYPTNVPIQITFFKV